MTVVGLLVVTLVGGAVYLLLRSERFREDDIETWVDAHWGKGSISDEWLLEASETDDWFELARQRGTGLARSGRPPALRARLPPSYQSPPSRVTIGEAVVQFLLSRRRAEAASKQLLHRLVDAAGSDLPLEMLQSRTVRECMARWYTDATPEAWNLNVRTLRAFVAYSQRQGWTARDPSLDVEPRPHHSHRRPLLLVS
ncbi:MAG: hypothetical protein ACRD0U_19315 [Acidimicrobiales bacterium]